MIRIAKRSESQWGMHLVLLLFTAACIFPLLLMFSISISDDKAIYSVGYSIWPSKTSFAAYTYIFQEPSLILKAYGVSSIVTFGGGLLSIIILILVAFPLSRSDFAYRKPVNFLVFFTMLFNGGLIPTYIVVTQVYGLKDSLWALILPYLVLPWYVLLLRTFFSAIPKELIEASQIDGCSENRLLWRIIVPISKPAIATVGLLCILRYWNDWYLSLLYMDNPNYQPLQLLLRTMINNILSLSQDFALGGTADFPTESARMAMAIIAAGPMLFIFLFFQRYFVSGLTVGAIKG
ncbi:sugar ABC transporter permease [Paenibacillus sp. Soil766]|uniref:carbohydrate ABC transporter permease n=1 Tax=Paenibacillus sp. Soil766 TaxID=1736404 RepID=UPI00070D9301|nr:carbohydrate ABC transporter permease [Paenibacillus sp. Soil766]KRF10288.1 sugar ABC transporter permease [Paenibacillus sp. Soil766]